MNLGKRFHIGPRPTDQDDDAMEVLRRLTQKAALVDLLQHEVETNRRLMLVLLRRHLGASSVDIASSDVQATDGADLLFEASETGAVLRDGNPNWRGEDLTDERD